MGKGGKCLDGKGWKLPERERVESIWMGKGGKYLEGKGWKVSGWERTESA